MRFPVDWFGICRVGECCCCYCEGNGTVKTGITSGGVVMCYYGGVYRHRQIMTECILSKQCNGVDMMERWFR